MRLTLSLSDYLKQGFTNVAKNGLMCPICYTEQLSHDVLDCADHIYRCFLLQQIDLELEKKQSPLSVADRDDVLNIVETRVTNYDSALVESIQLLL